MIQSYMFLVLVKLLAGFVFHKFSIDSTLLLLAKSCLEFQSLTRVSRLNTGFYAIRAKNWQRLVTITTNIYLTYITLQLQLTTAMLCHHFFPLMLDAQCKKPDLIMNINHLVTMQFAVHNWLSSYAMEAMVEQLSRHVCLGSAA